ncbi:hypothetical protein [Alteromonas sp. KUL49]|uniref:hypothetical protein n=1 Tax=Alteromonas sp. KUL49 TaxID=2480798 RepID=UPI00102EDC02|nr:hypothetical protein [Alteromonas sp. KUL49]TAP41307.1 hypothetical protein EYS00_03695 [Alteromonas sp. KUL49]GEA10367.1 hypothetical protein KUL49_07420 [Alteromonas sp. KUL49]
MFGFFKTKNFEPDFPIFELDESRDTVFEKLSTFAEVVTVSNPSEDVDLEYAAESDITRISIGFVGNSICYLNYLTSKHNSNEKQRANKLLWFLNHYGKLGEYDEPLDTGYLLVFNNRSNHFSVVFGLHKGPVRINKLSQGSHDV